MGTYTDLLKLTPKKPSPLSPTGEVVFGQSVPPEAEPTENTETTPPPGNAPLPEAGAASTQMPESQKTRILASQKTRKPDKPNARNLASQKTDLNGFLSSMREAKALAKTSYRYPQDLLDKLADVEYELRRNKGKKIHMNSIVVLALAYLLWEYEERGEESILMTLT